MMQDVSYIPKMIVIDDEPDIARLISDVADISGYEVAQYFDARAFVAQFNTDPDVIFLDLVMPDMSGMDVIHFLAEKKSRARIVLMTGYDTSALQTAEQAVVARGLHFVSGFKKPFRFDELRELLDRLKTVPPARA